MFYLIYVSCAVKKMSEGDLLSLHEESQEKNKKLDIRGMLLYKGQSFMQMIEGEKHIVLGLYNKIREDVRHGSVITIMSGGTSKRIFEEWSMGFCNMEQAGDFPHYDDYIKDNLTFNSFQENAEGAYKFMKLFNEVN